MTARSGPLSTSFTSSALSRSQCCFSKSASIFHASHCLGLSTKVCSRLPQIEVFGPPVSVSAGASDFRAAALVEQAGHAAGLRIDLHAKEFILQRVRRKPSASNERRAPSSRRARNKSGIRATACCESSKNRARCVSASIDKQLRLCRLSSGVDHLDLAGRRGQLRLNLSHFGARPGEGIEDHHRHCPRLAC